MDDALGHGITQLLQAWREGDERALDELTPQVYRELHLAAKRCMSRERGGHTLQTTALINALYLRLSDLKPIDWRSRTHFFALRARQMRRVLADQARARQPHKRGEGAKALSLDEALVISPQRTADLVAVDHALNQVAKVEGRKSQVAMRFFGGLSVEETAEVLNVSRQTVARDWRLAEARLSREPSGKKSDDA